MIHTYSIGNYFYLSGKEIIIKELHQNNYITIGYNDGVLLRVEDKDLRYIELGSNVLSRLTSEGRVISKLLRSTELELHRKDDYAIDLRGKTFYMSGYLFEHKSIFYFSQTITLHYLHQFQNLISILNPEVSLELPPSI